MNTDLDQLITIQAPDDLGACSLADLRTIRDHYQDVEHGLSYARRIVQGRLDTITVELERRSDSDGESDLVRRLPDALASHSRGPGLPRPVRDLDPPEWADELLRDADEVLSPSQLAHISDLDHDDLLGLTRRLSSFERQLSSMRHELHTMIDRVQDQLVGRYRGGAPVDDLLR